jgi:hypothetical protein
MEVFLHRRGEDYDRARTSHATSVSEVSPSVLGRARPPQLVDLSAPLMATQIPPSMATSNSPT